MNTIQYFGNSAYCYAHSTAMLLATIGESISPSLIEALTGVGLGQDFVEGPNLFFASGYAGNPDEGISRALRLLGFSFKDKYFKTGSKMPIDELREEIKLGPVILGPLDMGYLNYDPKHDHHGGIDHFVLAYAIDDEFVYVHDPADFPYVALSLEQLQSAWRAESIRYKRGSFGFWSRPKREKSVGNEELYQSAMVEFKQVYQKGIEEAERKNKLVNCEAIGRIISMIKENNELLEPAYGFMSGFSLPLGARRCLDYAVFLAPFNRELAEIKDKQARVYGLCQASAVRKDWDDLITNLKSLSDLEMESAKYLEK